ncbi:hypothetical protein EVAR_69870_1 [Eumeta japonica]|uniref:Uncharacterized protein n=1 Tax=Eumeta variegata TaxID=151549 RepID=A0A4C2A9P1_EUMVA|nr:hypothetical protein EVAR_69870_1 [Eumeta japonica]
MAFSKTLIVVIAFTTAAVLVRDGVEAKDKNKKAMAAEKENLRSAGREKGSFQKLAAQYANRTADRKSGRRRGDENINKLLEIHRSQKVNVNHMMNDNEGAIATNQKTVADNDTNTFPEKMKALRKEAPNYEVVYKNTYVPQVMGVFCNFENDTQDSMGLTCNWEWNSTLSNHNLGFKVVTAADIKAMNASSPHGFKFNGPATDADGKVDAHSSYFVLTTDDQAQDISLIYDKAFFGTYLLRVVQRGLWHVVLRLLVKKPFEHQDLLEYAYYNTSQISRSQYSEAWKDGFDDEDGKERSSYNRNHYSAVTIFPNANRTMRCERYIKLYMYTRRQTVG